MADVTDLENKIDNYDVFRENALCPNAYTLDFDHHNGTLPQELITDLIRNGNKSIFSPFVTDVLWNSLNLGPRNFTGKSKT